MFLIKIFFYICSSIFKINNNAAIKNDKISYFENSNHASTLWKLILRQKKWYFYKKCVGPFVKTQKKNQSSSSFNRLEGRNPLDSKGKIIRCTICESIHHWGQDCPDWSSQIDDTWLSQEAVLFQANFDNPNKLKGIVYSPRMQQYLTAVQAGLYVAKSG